MRIMGRQFVLGRTMKEALKHGREEEERGARFSFDMLGEGAHTAADAERYADVRRTRIVERAAAQAMDESALVSSEPVTVVLSRHGWARAAKGHEIDPSQLSYKAGDGFLASARCRSNQTAVFVDSTGRAYSMPAHSLPSARGQGEPLSGRFNPPDGASFGGVLAGQPEDRWLLATSAGYGFITHLSDLYSRNRAGKLVLRVPDGAAVLVPAPVPEGEGALVVAATDTGRLLCFPAEELPMLARGKGNKIIGIPAARFKVGDESMIAAAVVAGDGSVQVASGKRVMTLKPRDLEHYLGARGRRGALLPRGWRKVDELSVA
jgi:topoisomerase-4 subunit A